MLVFLPTPFTIIHSLIRDFGNLPSARHSRVFTVPLLLQRQHPGVFTCQGRNYTPCCPRQIVLPTERDPFKWMSSRCNCAQHACLHSTLQSPGGLYPDPAWWKMQGQPIMLPACTGFFCVCAPLGYVVQRMKLATRCTGPELWWSAWCTDLSLNTPGGYTHCGRPRHDWGLSPVTSAY